MIKNQLSYAQYWECIRDILVLAFRDKRICWSFFFSLLGLTVGIACNLCIPFFLKKIIESLSSPQNLTSITLILLSYGFIWMIGQFSNQIRALLSCKIEQRITSVLGVKVLSHLYTLPHRYFLSQKTGALTNVIRRAQRDVPNLVLGLLFHVVPTTLEFLFVIILIAGLYPVVYSLLMAGTLGAFFVYIFLSMKGVLRERERANEIDKSVDGIVTDWLSNYEAIKVFGKHDLAIQMCENELKKRENSEIRFIKKYYLSHMGQFLILGLGLSALTYLVGQDVLKGLLTVGDFVLFNGYILQFIIPISILGHVAQDIRKAMLDMKGVVELLSTPSDIKEGTESIPLTRSNFSVQFENICFPYNDRDVLKNVSFKIEPGETALIVGKTGVGKSTIAKLILRLYDPTNGQIMINGVNIKRISLESLYHTVGWVPQEIYLLNDTIQANVQFARPEATHLEIEEALDQAHLLDFVKKLPQGLHTIVGDRGLKLSGGEKQRIGLARLFLKNPKVCIFDESTSSLDKETDLIIQNNIENFFSGVTKIIITHRPHLIRKVDQVISISHLSNGA